MPDEVDYSDVKNASVKPGWQSTEAWFTMIAQILGAVMYSGLLSSDDPVEAKILKLGGVALAILSALGYKVQRGWVKTTATKGAAMVAIAEANAEAAKAAAMMALAAGAKPENPPPPSP